MIEQELDKAIEQTKQVKNMLKALNKKMDLLIKEVRGCKE